MPAPKKPKNEQRRFFLQVRVSEDERRLFKAAAKALGVDVSTWLRELGEKAASRTLAKEG